MFSWREHRTLSSDPTSQPLLAAVTKYHKLGGFWVTEVHSSWFWRWSPSSLPILSVRTYCLVTDVLAVYPQLVGSASLGSLLQGCHLLCERFHCLDLMNFPQSLILSYHPPLGVEFPTWGFGRTLSTDLVAVLLSIELLQIKEEDHGWFRGRNMGFGVGLAWSLCALCDNR